MSPFAQMTSRDEGFEGYANETPAPTGAILINPLGHRVFIVDPTFTQGQPIGAFGMSPNSFRWQFINMGGGDNASLIFDQLRLRFPHLNMGLLIPLLYYFLLHPQFQYLLSP